MHENIKIIDKAVKILSDNLGQNTAMLYKNFYSNKNNKEILLSINELLVELVGSNNAKKQMQKLYKLI